MEDELQPSRPVGFIIFNDIGRSVSQQVNYDLSIATGCQSDAMLHYLVPLSAV